MPTNFDDMKIAVEALSGSKNTVKLDNVGMPSIVVPVPALTYADVGAGDSTDLLPAFLIDGVEKKMFVDKFQNIIIDGRAYSLPGQDPKATITFDAALAACRAKGDNWGLNTAALWGAIMCWCYKNGTVPRGNTNYGKAYNYPHEKGIPTYMYSATQVGRTATGSGPETWYHNHQTTGIADLVGNVAEWLGGLRTVNGAIQVIQYNNALKSSVSMGAESTDWKAILFSDGSIVEPGTEGTVKFDGKTASSGLVLNNQIVNSTGETYFSEPFNTLAAATGLTIPAILQVLGLAPISGNTYAGTVYVNNAAAERLPIRGGIFSSASIAGLGFCRLYYPRSNSYVSIGFRAASYE